VIGRLIENSPAEKAGLRVGDLVVAANGLHISDWQALVAEIQAHPSQKLRLDITRDQQTFSLEVVPDAVKENGEFKGQIGAALKVDEQALSRFLVTQHYSLPEALQKAAYKTWETSIFSLKMLANMLTGYVSVKTISGPVTIANYAGQSAHLGLKAFIGFLAMISISLGVLNLLPIPVLDGGHLLYYIVEIVKGSPVSEKTMEIGQRIGMFILMLLMTCALYNDINRLIAS
jgi:regulator of sigma E protease